MIPNRLLILDDEPITGRLVCGVAETAGFACKATTTASQFFQELERLVPTHIVLDLMMPDMDGVEVLEILARQGCGASIIIASGVGGRILDAASRTGKEHGLNMGGVLSKPFSPAQLRELLGKGESDSENSRARRADFSLEKTPEISAEAFNCALDNDELELVYQPKINCHNDHLAGFEALVRWKCPQRGIVSPDSFIRIAETNGLMGKMTRQVIEQAVAWFKVFLDGIEDSESRRNTQDMQRSQTIQELTLCINLSARSLDDPELFEFVIDQCKLAGIEHRRINFELTESSALKDPVASLKVLTRLRVRGFRLSIDDFGAGFSSMIQLVRLPFSEVKLDRWFVMAALRSEESRTVIRSIVDLGHSLGLAATGEGVEDLNTFEYLCQTGCDLAQGHFISRPVSGAEAISWGQDHLESWR